MDTKKVVDFLVMKSSINSRNLTSLLLVAFFFLIYILAGGRVSVLPKGIKPAGASFGAIADPRQQAIAPAIPDAPPLPQPESADYVTTTSSDYVGSASGSPSSADASYEALKNRLERLGQDN